MPLPPQPQIIEYLLPEKRIEIVMKDLNNNARSAEIKADKYLLKGIKEFHLL